MNFSLTLILFTIAAFCVAVFFSSFSFLQKPYSSSVDKINNKTCSDLKRLYDMDCVGRGLGLEKPDNKKILNIYLSLRIRKIVNINEAREMALTTLDTMMNNVNNETKFLSEYAVGDFDEANLYISIIFLTPDEKEVLDPNIAAVSLGNYEIQFHTNDPKPPHPYKNEFVESLEEARAKVAAQEKTLD